MIKGTKPPTLLLLPLFALALLWQGCGWSGPSPAPVAEQPSATTPPPQQTPQTAFERDLEFIRKGRFTYTWVFSRKDGKPIDKEDAAYLRKHAPQVVDWVTTDEGRRVIAGTNFNLEEGDLDLLRKRFVIEDYSGK
ncbi:MAG TPA: hypothetical protein VMM84_15415 [Pyrinomonadaceae bacterium]|nr:hypothetical protein [Pyrinomonadaceae bacterium]